MLHVSSATTASPRLQGGWRWKDVVDRFSERCRSASGKHPLVVEKMVLERTKHSSNLCIVCLCVYLFALRLISDEMTSCTLHRHVFYFHVCPVLKYFLPNGATACPAVTPAPTPGSGPPPPVFHPMPPTSTPAPATYKATKTAKPGVKVCSFYNKKKGCQVGALCPFLHQGIEGGGLGGTRGRAQPPPAAAAAATPAVVSPRACPVPVVAAAPATTPKAKESKATVIFSPVTAPAVNLAATAPAAAAAVTTLGVLPVATPPPPAAAVQTAAVAAEAGVAGESSSSRRTRKRGRSETPAAAADSAGLFGGLPISPFVTPKTAAKSAASQESAVAPAVPLDVPHPKADVWKVNENILSLFLFMSRRCTSLQY